ncbi:MAG: hypothetical protein M1368_10745 [Thaumarchaeota archaeon]|nr:hypothetical protein [Nitrososphaerota archaeon]
MRYEGIMQVDNGKLQPVGEETGDEGGRIPQLEVRNRILTLSTSRGILFFGMISCLMLLTTQMLHAFIHEVLGHGLFSILVGQQFGGFFVSPFGASYSHITSSTVLSLLVLQAAAGMLVSVACGIIILTLVYPWMKKRGSSFQLRLFVLFFILMLLC